MEDRRGRLFARLYRLRNFGQIEHETYERFVRRAGRAQTDKQIEKLEEVVEKSVLRPWKKR